MKPAQLSIRSFFHSKTPKYAPPPSQAPITPPSELPSPAPIPRQQQQNDVPPSKREEEGTNNKQQQVVTVAPLPADSLPREASVRPITPHDINALRRINALLLPVSYPDAFYQRAVDNPLSRVITWAHDGAEPKVVGGVVCRVEPPTNPNNSSNPGPQNLYIQSLCLLSPYRSLGLITAAVDNIIATAVADDGLDVRSVTAHVWTENEEGLKWYEGRDFRRDAQPIRGYYLKLRPDSAWLVSRDVTASVRASLPSSNPTPPPANPIPESITAAVVNLPPTSGPPRATRPPPSRTGSGQSYQNQRPDMEWNDLPDDMAAGKLAPPRKGLGETPSGTSSRSSSTARKKRDRSYPAAAFGA